MNLSGQFINQMCHYYQIDYKNVLVILDDINIEVGKFKLRRNGTDGGHNGMKNIIHLAKTNEIKRLKIGVSNLELLKKISLNNFFLTSGVFNAFFIVLNNYITSVFPPKASIFS